MVYSYLTSNADKLVTYRCFEKTIYATQMHSIQMNMKNTVGKENTNIKGKS